MAPFENFCSDLLNSPDLFRDVCAVIGTGAGLDAIADLARSRGYDVEVTAFYETALLDGALDRVSGALPVTAKPQQMRPVQGLKRFERDPGA